MFRKLALAAIIAILTAVGIVIPTPYLEGLLNLVVPAANASVYCIVPPSPCPAYPKYYDLPCKTTIVEAFGPSSPHFSGSPINRSNAT